MALLMVNEENLYRFSTIEDAILWIEMHRTDEDIIILGEAEDTEDVETYLQQVAPIEIIAK